MMKLLKKIPKFWQLFLFLGFLESRFLFGQFFYQKILSFAYFDLWTIWHLFMFLCSGLSFMYWKKSDVGHLLLFFVLAILFISHSLHSDVFSNLYYFLSFYVLPIFTVVLLIRSKVFSGFTIFLSLFLALIGFGAMFDFALVDFMNRLTFPYVDPFNILQLTSANWLASLLSVVILLSLEFDRFSVFKCVVLFVSFLALLWTQSYGAIVGLLVALIYYFLKYRLFSLKRILSVLVIVFLLASPYVYRTQKFQVLLGNYHMPNSIERRVQLYDVSWQMFLDAPWTGIGINNFQNSFALKQVEVLDEIIPEHELPPHPHSAVLFFVLEFGVLGLLIYLFWVLKIASFRASSATVYFFIHALIDMPFLTLEHSFLYWLAFFL